MFPGRFSFARRTETHLTAPSRTSLGMTSGIVEVSEARAEFFEPARGEVEPEAAGEGKCLVEFRYLSEIAFFIPKSIREPFLGDLREPPRLGL
jgi:hypothetical protein